VLKVIHDAVPGADILDIRRVDNVTKSLYFAVTHGEAWDQGSNREVAARRGTRRKLEDCDSVEARALAGEDLVICSDPEELRKQQADFPAIRRIALAPLKSEGRAIGLLEVRGTGRRDFPTHVEPMLQIVVQQLNLYQSLADIVKRRRDLERQRTLDLDRQTQIYQDLSHQLRSPIIQAYARIQAALRADFIDDRLRLKLLRIRGLCGKAKRVTVGVKLFVDLASNQPISVCFEPLRSEKLVPMLVEAASDHELLVEPERKLRFDVDKRSFDSVDRRVVRADFELIEQAVSNVIDNAGKYSYSETTVRVFGGITGKDRFHISVTNKGIPIPPREVKRCIERGYRSDEAKAVTGEGSGIGLWLVEAILRAHGGELLIIPVNQDGLTEVKLLFPVVKED
jgi:signal transduction histidine kinase